MIIGDAAGANEGQVACEREGEGRRECERMLWVRNVTPGLEGWAWPGRV